MRRKEIANASAAGTREQNEKAQPAAETPATAQQHQHAKSANIYTASRNECNRQAAQPAQRSAKITEPTAPCTATSERQ